MFRSCSLGILILVSLNVAAAKEDGQFANALTLEVAEKAYEKAVYAAKIRQKSADAGFDPTRVLISDFAVEQLIETGSMLLENADDSASFEMAGWFLEAGLSLKAAESREAAESRGERKRPPRRDSGGDLALLTGQALALGTQQYIDPGSENYDGWRAFYLHRKAAARDLQTSAMAAAYLQTYLQDDVLTSSHNVTMLLNWASNCTSKNMGRELLPYTKELCEKAESEAVAVEKQANAAMRMRNTDPAITVVMGLIGLGVLAAVVSGDDPSSIPDSGINEFKRFQATVDQYELETYF